MASRVGFFSGRSVSSGSGFRRCTMWRYTGFSDFSKFHATCSLPNPRNEFMSTYSPPSDLCDAHRHGDRQLASDPSGRNRGGAWRGRGRVAYRGVEGDAALVLVDAVGGLRDADLVEVRAEEIHGRGPRRATAEPGCV